MTKKTITKELTGAQDLYNFLFEACNIIRGPVSQDNFKDYITPLLYYKRISDVYDEETEDQDYDDEIEEDYEDYSEEDTEDDEYYDEKLENEETKYKKTIIRGFEKYNIQETENQTNEKDKSREEMKKGNLDDLTMIFNSKLLNSNYKDAIEEETDLELEDIRKAIAEANIRRYTRIKNGNYTKLTPRKTNKTNSNVKRYTRKKSNKKEQKQSNVKRYTRKKVNSQEIQIVRKAQKEETPKRRGRPPKKTV